MATKELRLPKCRAQEYMQVLEQPLMVHFL